MMRQTAAGNWEGVLGAGQRVVPAPVQPRWRFADCKGQSPQRVVWRLARSLRGPRRSLYFTSSAYTNPPQYVLVAAGAQPTGVAIALKEELPALLDPRWANQQDQLNFIRGIAPSALWLLKCAACRARFSPPGRMMKRLHLVPLPYTSGEVLISAGDYWRARGIAWWQENALLALVWEVPPVQELVSLRGW